MGKGRDGRVGKKARMKGWTEKSEERYEGRAICKRLLQNGYSNYGERI